MYMLPGLHSFLFLVTAKCPISMYALSQQLRLDFRDVQLAQPDENGVCVEDRLSIIDGSAVPVLCGDLSGHHGKTVYQTEHKHL